MNETPRFRAQDWPGTRDAINMVLTLLLLLVWLAALIIAFDRWTGKTALEAAALAALGLGVVAMIIGFLRNILRQRRRCVDLAARGVWRRATVTLVARGADPTGIQLGIRQGWIVTATAPAWTIRPDAEPDDDERVVTFCSTPQRSLRRLRDLVGRKVWVLVDPDAPDCHVLLPLSPADAANTAIG